MLADFQICISVPSTITKKIITKKKVLLVTIFFEKYEKKKRTRFWSLILEVNERLKKVNCLTSGGHQELKS